MVKKRHINGGWISIATPKKYAKYTYKNDGIVIDFTDTETNYKVPVNGNNIKIPSSILNAYGLTDIREVFVEKLDLDKYQILAIKKSDIRIADLKAVDIKIKRNSRVKKVVCDKKYRIPLMTSGSLQVTVYAGDRICLVVEPLGHRKRPYLSEIKSRYGLNLKAYPGDSFAYKDTGSDMFTIPDVWRKAASIKAGTVVRVWRSGDRYVISPELQKDQITGKSVDPAIESLKTIKICENCRRLLLENI